ncbi:MAG: DUF6572 domain-containing protein [Gemmatimonadales bacterium]
MTVGNPKVIDFVALDQHNEVVTLVMVEERNWGERGTLLPDLQAKLNTYLAYAVGGQLYLDYPEVRGKAVCFQLSYVHSPGPRERQLIDIVRRQHLEPERIAWRETSLLPAV